MMRCLTMREGSHQQGVVRLALLLAVVLPLAWNVAAAQGTDQSAAIGPVDARTLASIPVALSSGADWGKLPPPARAWLMASLHQGQGIPEAAAQLVANAPVRKALDQDFHARHDSPALWLRHFHGDAGAEDGLVLYARVDCTGLRNLAARDGTAAASAAATAGCGWLQSQPAGVLDTGAKLYRLTRDGTPMPVTAVAGRLFPALEAADWQQLRQKRAGEPFLDAEAWACSNASPVLLEQDPEQDLPAEMPGYGPPHPGAVLGGWLRWNGQAFVVDPPLQQPAER